MNKISKISWDNRESNTGEITLTLEFEDPALYPDVQYTISEENLKKFWVELRLICDVPNLRYDWQ